MADDITYSVGEDGVAVEYNGEVYFYSEHTRCASCSKQSDGVMVPKKGTVPEVRKKGVPLCDECEDIRDQMDHQTDYDFVEYE